MKTSSFKKDYLIGLLHTVWATTLIFVVTELPTRAAEILQTPCVYKVETPVCEPWNDQHGEKRCSLEYTVLRADGSLDQRKQLWVADAKPESSSLLTELLDALSNGSVSKKHQEDKLDIAVADLVKHLRSPGTACDSSRQPKLASDIQTKKSAETAAAPTETTQIETPAAGAAN